MATILRIKITDGTHTVYSSTSTVSTDITKTFNITDLSSLTNGMVDICVQCQGDAGQVGERVFIWWNTNDNIYTDRKNSFLTFGAEGSYTDLDITKAYFYADATSFRASVRYKP